MFCVTERPVACAMIIDMIQDMLRHKDDKPRTRKESVVIAFAHGAMGRRIDPSWGGPIELFLVPASAPRLLIGKSSPCGGSGFPLSPSGPMSYNRK